MGHCWIITRRQARCRQRVRGVRAPVMRDFPVVRHELGQAKALRLVLLVVGLFAAVSFLEKAELGGVRVADDALSPLDK